MAEEQNKPARRHGSAKVGIGVTAAPDINRLIGRRFRLEDALKRATGERKASLEAEIARINGELTAVQKQLAEALAPAGGTPQA